MIVEWRNPFMVKALLIIIGAIIGVAIIIGIAFWLNEFVIQDFNPRINRVLPLTVCESPTGKSNHVQPV